MVSGMTGWSNWHDHNLRFKALPPRGARRSPFVRRTTSFSSQCLAGRPHWSVVAKSWSSITPNSTVNRKYGYVAIGQRVLDLMSIYLLEPLRRASAAFDTARPASLFRNWNVSACSFERRLGDHSIAEGEPCTGIPNAISITAFWRSVGAQGG